MFLEYIKSKGDVELEFQQSKIKAKTKTQSFSVIGYGGKTGRKSILQINTNIDVTNLKKIIIDDRYRGEGVKMKGSLGSERYEVFIRNEDEMKHFCDFIINLI